MSNPLHFSRTIHAEKSVDFTQEPKLIKGFETQTKEYPIDTKDSDVLEMIQMVRDGKREDIIIPNEFGNLKATVKSFWMNNVGDFDGDGNLDSLLLRTTTIPYVNKPTTTSAWLVAVKDDNGDGQLSADEEKAGVVISSATMMGENIPITEISVNDFNNDGRTDVAYTKHIDGKSKTYRAISQETPVIDKEEDNALIESAMLYYDAVIMAEERGYVKYFIRKEFEAELGAIGISRAVVFPEVLRPLYSSLKMIDTRSPDNRTLLQEDLTQGQARMFALNKILTKAGDLELELTAEEMAYRTEATTTLSRQFDDLENSLEWNGELVTHSRFEQMLASQPDDAVRLAMAEHYKNHYAPIYAEGGTYHQYIERMNEIAINHGYEHYADMRIRQVFGISYTDFRTWVDDTLNATEKSARAYIDALQEFSGKESLRFWDVGFYKQAWVKQQTGLVEFPSFTSNEILGTPENPSGLLDRYYADLGFDLRSDPYNRITMDPFLDPLKPAYPGVAATATPADAYFTSNIVPGENILLRESETFTHETVHDVHYITAGQKLPGISSYLNTMPGYVTEGIGLGTQDIPFMSPALIKRYFGDNEGFSEAFIQKYPEVLEMSQAWQTRMLIHMALTEVNLYANPGSWSEKLNDWPTRAKEDLFVDPEGIELGPIIYRTHPVGGQHQLYYASYPLGAVNIRRIRDAMIKEGTPEELKLFGDVLREIMSGGALMDQAQINDIVKRVEKK
jgi:hypothetical protein